MPKPAEFCIIARRGATVTLVIFSVEEAKAKSREHYLDKIPGGSAKARYIFSSGWLARDTSIPLCVHKTFSLKILIKNSFIKIRGIKFDLFTEHINFKARIIYF